MNSSMSNQSTGSSDDFDYEVGERYESNEVLNEQNHSLIITTLIDEDGLTIPESFELRSVGRKHWFSPKIHHDEGYTSVRNRQFLCVAECKEQLDEWVSELVSGENQTIDQVFLLGEDVIIEWDEQSEKLIIMP